MLIHWRSLLAFGLVFWIVLCLNDFLGPKSNKFSISDLDELYTSPTAENIFKKNSQSEYTLQQQYIKFGWSLTIWNVLTFLFSMACCSVARVFSWFVWKIFINYRNRSAHLKSIPKPTERSNSTLSKIPIKIKSLSANSRSSDTDLKIKSKVEADASCPNLLSKRSQSNFSMDLKMLNCKTLYKNKIMFSPDGKENGIFDRHLENQCARLRDEMAKMQAASLKENAMLSRKLEAVSKEKRELSKQLAVAQKENRAARQQIEELLHEKGVIVKRLENATKEFKANTKSKKFALAKLEEVTAHADNLQQQLQQVSRDKEILENKLKVLEGEYEKLHERLFLSNRNNTDNYHENTPERDVNPTGDKEKVENRPNQSECYGDFSSNKVTPADLASVSQTDLDMKQIQVKIKQLEKNLENFNATKPDLNFMNGDQVESDISLSLHGNNTDSQARTDDETDDVSDNILSNNPRLKYWGGRAGDVFQALASRMNEKVRFFDNIRERANNVVPEETELDGCSSRGSLDSTCPPERIVSNSVAFQNFLKCLQPTENNRGFVSHTESLF